MRRFLAILLCAAIFAALTGCEQELSASLFAEVSPSNFQNTLTEQAAATHILIIDEKNEYYGRLIEYFGRCTDNYGDTYACAAGYCPSENALRVTVTVSGTDPALSDSLWLCTSDSAKLRRQPQSDAELLSLVESGSVLEAAAVSFTDALYYAVNANGEYGYIVSSAVTVSPHRAESELYSVFEKYSPAAAQLTVISGGDIIGTYVCGYADRENGTLMTADTKIRVASLSKTVLAIAALKMQDDGIVDIDECIGTYWGIDSIPGGVSLRTVLTHTSTVKPLDSYYDLDKLKAHLSDGSLFNKSQKPGSASAWEYNNFAVGIGGATLELAVGFPLWEYLNNNVFAPMSITASYGYAGLPEESPRAVLYSPDGTAVSSESILLSVSNIPGDNSRFFAGGLCISSEDYAKLLIMLMNDGVYENERILSESAVNEIEAEYLAVNDSTSEFSQCLIFRKAELYNRSLYYHSGNAYGVIALASYEPETGDGVVIITTGMGTERSANGIYKICDELSQIMYTEIL